ncbi:MAG: ferrous iron transport protein A [Planctomycetes bacterium]|nr:ferrous iron transport protein A [Planctomycetota bacterium]
MLNNTAESVASRPLSEAPESTSYCVDRVSGPDKRRLCEMGLVEGAEISVVKRARPGTVILKVGDCRLALARGMDGHVWVR